MKTELALAASSRRVSSLRQTKRISWQWLPCTLALAILLGTAVVAALPAQAQTFTVLYSFTGGSDGATPNGVVLDSAGNLYGTTLNGGTFNLGTVCKLNTNGKKTVLWTFDGTTGGNPFTGLVRDSSGNLYGTTQGGGSSGWGTVFKLTP